MARRAFYVLAVTLLGALAMPASPAFAGGGCHTAATTGAGDTVELRDMCFTPTTLQIATGDTVTFVNRDSLVHMVGGTGWGHFDDLIVGAVFTATFGQPGIYPYACIYHPGMTGAIVVGGGSGAGNGTAVTVASYQPPAPSPQVEIRTADASDRGSGGATGWLFGGALGLVAGLGGGLTLRRRARRVPIAT